jgi:hypothetical protein
LNFFIASTIAVFDCAARLGIIKPALPPLVPWQPAQANEIISGVGGAAEVVAENARAPAAKAQPLHDCFIVVSSC